MMKNLVIFILAFSLTLLSSCGGKGEQTDTKFELSTSAISVAGFEGGIMIYGTHLKTGVSFGKVLDSEPVELINGDWNFMYVGWDGVHGTFGPNNQLEGTMKCGVSAVNLKGGDQTVSINFNLAGCGEGVFGADSTKSGNYPKPVKFFGCSNRNDFNEEMDNSNCADSLSGGFRIKLPQTLPNGEIREGLVSRCIQDDTTGGEMDDMTNAHEIKLPMFVPVIGSPDIVVEVYEDSLCNDFIGASKIEHLYAHTYSGQPFNLNDKETGHNELLVGVPTCNAPNGNLTTPFNNGSYDILCNKDQIENHVPTALTGTYLMDTDISLEYASYPNAVIQGNFSGNFDGNGYEIRDFEITDDGTNPAGLFQTISGNVKNLNLANVNTYCSGAAFAAGLGALAGTVATPAKIEDISLRDSDLTGTSCQNFGGLFGILITGGAVEVDGVTIRNLNISISDNSTRVGGVVGDFQDGHSLSNVRINGFSFEETSGTTNSTSFGSVAGRIQGAGASIENVFAEGIEIGNALNPLLYKQEVGMVVGYAGLDASLSNIKATGSIHTGSNVKHVGGLVGESANFSAENIVIDMDAVVANVGGDTDISIGGILGRTFAPNTGSLIVKLDNVRTTGAIECGRDHCGGILAHGQAGASASIEITKAYSNIDFSDSQGDYVGGIVGFAFGGPYTMEGVQFEGSAISSGDKVGGIIGGSGGSLNLDLDHAFVGANVDGNDLVGGLAGELDGTALVIDFVLINSEVTGNSNIFTDIGDAPGSVPTIDTTGNCFHVDYGAGDNGYCTARSDAQMRNLGGGSFPSFVGATYVSGEPAWFDGVVSNVQSELGFVNILKNFGDGFAVGNYQDPYVITTREAWNSIGDKPFLMDKVFALGATINFNFTKGDFNPIGSVGNPFKGALFPNNYGLVNIDHEDTTGPQPLGIFRRIQATADGDVILQNPDLEEDDFPKLYIRNVRFKSDQGSVGILAGEAFDFNDGTNDSALFIAGIDIAEAYIVQDNSATDALGGLIGAATFDSERSEIQQIRIEGLEIDGSASNSGAVGGIIGSISQGGFIGSNYKLKALRSLDLDINCPACNRVAGMFGEVNSSYLEAENLIVDNATILANSTIGGLIGDADFGTISQVAISNLSLDTSSTTGEMGGLISTVNSGTIKGVSVNADTIQGPSASGNTACGIAFVTAAEISNSYFNCQSVTGAITSYAIPSGELGGMTGGADTTNSIFYVGRGGDESLTGGRIVYFANEDSLRDESIMSSYANFKSLDPWVIKDGSLPITVMEEFPEFFFF